MSNRIDDDYVKKQLIDYEIKLGRAIRRNDISTEKIGFSMIVINRIWGSLEKCKNDLGLICTPTSNPRPFKYYKDILDSIIEDIKKNTKRENITWKDIEQNNLNISIDHKSLTKAFKREGLDIFQYLAQNGLQMNPSSFSFHYTLLSGERVLSSMEYDTSNFLNDVLNLQYGIDYKRDVMYKTFLPYKHNSKLNCDYEFIGKDKNNLYMEIAGMITNKYDDWRTRDYGNVKNNEYRDNMILKENLFLDNNIKYLILFKNDFDGCIYKNKIYDFLKANGSD